MRVRRVRLQGQPLVSGEARWAGGDAAMPAWGPAHNFQHRQHHTATMPLLSGHAAHTTAHALTHASPCPRHPCSSQSADACPTETENEDRFFEPKGAPKRDAKSPCA